MITFLSTDWRDPWRENKGKRVYQDTHLFSAASMLMASMMFLTFSVICLALIVCCSNFVFTADCEIHSCEAITHKLLWQLWGHGGSCWWGCVSTRWPGTKKRTRHTPATWTYEKVRNKKHGWVKMTAAEYLSCVSQPTYCNVTVMCGW